MTRQSVLMGIILVMGCAVANALSQPKKLSDEHRALQALVHVNSNRPVRQGHGLNNIANILKQAPNTEIEVVCHGDGIKLVVEGESRHTEKIKELIGKGVRFIACENTLKEKQIPRARLLPHVKTVSSRAVKVNKKQQEGFSYFKP